MHSTLAMTAALWRAEHPALEHSIQLEGICQKGEAMRGIRARLAHAGSVRDDDEMSFLMSTVSTLVIVEVYRIVSLQRNLRSTDETLGLRQRLRGRRHASTGCP